MGAEGYPRELLEDMTELADAMFVTVSYVLDVDNDDQVTYTQGRRIRVPAAGDEVLVHNIGPHQASEYCKVRYRIWDDTTSVRVVVQTPARFKPATAGDL